jgi:hypothetical protein
MTMKNAWLGSVLLACLSLTACAGMMMDVKEAEKGQENLALKAGDEVSVALPDVKAIEEEFGAEDAKRVASLIKLNLEKELADDKVKVVTNSPRKLHVKVTNYQKGCGFCRGFFPVFGLGDSAVDGEVLLEGDGQQRKLIIQKTGQMSGTSQMGDQTETNVEYFAEVVVARLTGAAKEEDEEE